MQQRSFLLEHYHVIINGIINFSRFNFQLAERGIRGLRSSLPLIRFAPAFLASGLTPVRPFPPLARRSKGVRIPLASSYITGGERGIRTLGAFYCTYAFQAYPFAARASLQHIKPYSSSTLNHISLMMSKKSAVLPFTHHGLSGVRKTQKPLSTLTGAFARQHDDTRRLFLINARAGQDDGDSGVLVAVEVRHIPEYPAACNRLISLDKLYKYGGFFGSFERDSIYLSFIR